MLAIMYCPDCCFGLLTACIDDWLFAYIEHLRKWAGLFSAMFIAR